MDQYSEIYPECQINIVSFHKLFLPIAHSFHYNFRVSAFVQTIGEYLKSIKALELLRRYLGTLLSVKFIVYRNLLPSPEETFYIGCCEQHRIEDLRKLMKQHHCVAINSSQEELYNNTEMIINVRDPHKIIDEPLKLK